MSWIDRHFIPLLFAILASATLLYAALNPQYRTGVFNDDAVFVISAQDLWNTSASHSLLHLKPDYPLPGLPLLLAPFAKWIQPHWTFLEWISVFTTVLSVLLLGLWSRRWVSSGEALIITAIYAFNPSVARYSGILMPAPYYAIAALASFLLMDELCLRPTTLKALALGVVLGWASVIRAEGILLLLAVTGTLLMTQAGRKQLRIVAIPWLAWLFVIWLWVSTRHATETEYGIDVATLLTYWTHHTGSMILFCGDLFRVFLVGIVTALSWPKTALASWIGVGLAALFLAAVVAGFRRLWREHSERQFELVGLGVFCVLYTVVHLFWHVASKRYAVPLLPFVLVFLVREVSAYFQSLERRKMWTSAAIFLLLMSYTYKNGHAVYESLWAPDPMKSPPWRSLSWLKQETPPSAKIISPIAPMIFLYTGRFAIQRLVTHNEEKFLYMSLQGSYDYVVDRQISFVTPGVDPRVDPNGIWARIRHWIQHYPQSFQVVFSESRERTAIYHLVYEPGFKEAYEKYTAAAQEYHARHFGSAAHLVGQCLAVYPKLGSAMNLQGALDLMQGNRSNAEHNFLRAIELLPDSTTAMMNLAALYHQQGKTQKEVIFLQQAEIVSQANDEQVEFKEKIQSMQDHWAQHKGILFVDAP